MLLGSSVFSPQGTTAAVHPNTSVLRSEDLLLSRKGVVGFSQTPAGVLCVFELWASLDLRPMQGPQPSSWAPAGEGTRRLSIWLCMAWGRTGERASKKQPKQHENAQKQAILAQ